ncbi:MAG: tetratricopeptide repeat protein [Saprospiraceae bacterium]|nr:tetratricopeptide repeat protein [Saprospiraceae bacterium]
MMISMKSIVSIILFLITVSGNGLAQQDSVYSIVEVRPFLRSCMRAETDLEREQCSNQRLLTSIYKSIVYPDSALANQTEGTVVAQFVVNNSGFVQDPRIIRDIGDGCGDAVLLVLNKLGEIGPVWRPALMDSIPVNFLFTVPIKFNIPPPPPPPLPYQVIGSDTVYHAFDTPPIFGESIQDLEYFLSENLKAPASYRDSCFCGPMVAQVLIGKNGVIRISEVFDYAGLGFDYQFQLIQLLNSTTGKWKPATFEGNGVNSVYAIRAEFSPKASSCDKVAIDYAGANEKARQGELLFAEGKTDEAIELWSSAIQMFPENAEYRLLRGQALMESGNFDSTVCEDLEIARQKVAISALLEGSYNLICGSRPAQEE